MLSRTDLSRLATVLGGIPVLGCLDGSPAAEAGIRYGDILLAIDGVATSTWDDFIEVRGRCRDRMLARIFRDGVEREIDIELRPSNKTPMTLLGELQQHGITPITGSGRRDVH